jgi:putative phosphoesterase
VRLAVIGDVHGNRVALEAVLDALARERPDRVVCLGDLAFRGPEPGRVVARLRALGIPCVQGNTDLMLLAARSPEDAARVPPACWPPAASLPWVRWHLERLGADDLAYLAGLPLAHREDVGGQRLLFVHATPQDTTSTIEPLGSRAEVELRLRDVEADWLFVGHIHRAFALRLGRVQLVNPGAVGFSLDRDPRAAYALVEPERGRIALERVPYDVEAAVEAARREGFCFPLDEYRRALVDGFWEAVPWEARRWGA